MRARALRRHASAALLATLFGGLALGSFVRVPPGHIGVTRDDPPRVIPPGTHLRLPFASLVIYPEAPVSAKGETSVLTREGARIPVSYEVRARLAPGRGIAPAPAMASGEPEAALAEAIALLVDGTLTREGGGDPAALRARLQSALADSGLQVLSLNVKEGTAGRTTPPLDHPIVVVGLDGADWEILDPLIDSGRAPNLGRLKGEGAWGHMRASEPILSPLLWTTAVTGKTPDEHGILDFLVTDPATGRRTPITSRARRVRAIWNIFSERGLDVDVVAWWATWPAEPIEGRMISDRVAYSLFDVAGAGEGLTWPAGLYEALKPVQVDEDGVGYQDIARFVDIGREEYDAVRARAGKDRESAWQDPVSHLARIIASTRTYHAMTLDLVRSGQPDLLLVYYQGIDEVSHRFAHFMPPRMPQIAEREYQRYQRAVESFYEWQDELVGDLIGALDRRSTILVMSDHGFHNGSSRPTDGPADIEGKPGKWHRPYGIVMIAGEGIPRGRIETATLLDVTPTVLTLAGLPLADDMPGVPLVRRDDAEAPASIVTYETGPPPGSTSSGEHDAVAAADEELLRNLESLGYIGPTPGRATAAEPAGTGVESVTAHTNLAAVLLRKGDLEGAEKELREALALRPAYFPALMSLAQTLVRQGRHAEAFETTRRAVTTVTDPEPVAYVQLALIARRVGKEEETIRQLESLGARRGPGAGIETALGVIAEGTGDEETARRRYRAALAHDAAFTEAMARLFALQRRDAREVECEPEIRRALAVNDRSVMHQNWLGLILERKGDRAGAEAAFRKALALAPDFAGTMVNLGSFYGRGGRLEEAALILERAVRIDPKNLEARVNLGASFAKLGRLDEAIKNLEEARALGLKSTELLNAVGLAYAQSGRTGEAVQALRESLSLTPDQPRVRDLLRELMPPT